MKMGKLTRSAWAGLFKWAGYAIYALAVVFADSLFLAMLRSMFPDGLLGTLAFIGGLATGASMLVLPLAKAYWVKPGQQAVAALVFWFAEFVVMVLNVLLAWQESQGTVDPLFVMWKYYGTAATPLLAMVGWFALWTTDPSQRLRDAQHEMEAEILERLREQYIKALEDSQVYEALVQGAREQARLLAEQMAAVRLALPSPSLNHREPPEEEREREANPFPSS